MTVQPKYKTQQNTIFSLLLFSSDLTAPPALLPDCYTAQSLAQIHLQIAEVQES